MNGATGEDGPVGTRVGEVPSRREPDRGRPRPRWWPGPGIALLMFSAVVFLLLFVLPTYLSLDPGQARIVLNENPQLHFNVLLAHVATGTVALVTGCLQVWPRLRQRHPAVHRFSGRIYLAAVLLGAPVLAVLLVFRAETPGDTTSTIVVGFSLQTILWIGTTVTGFRRARQRRYAAHRRMMVYSFALTVSIIWSRFAFVVAFAVPGLGTDWIDENTGWLWWVLSLLVAHWWLNRTARRPLVLPSTTPATAR